MCRPFLVSKISLLKCTFVRLKPAIPFVVFCEVGFFCIIFRVALGGLGSGYVVWGFSRVGLEFRLSGSRLCVFFCVVYFWFLVVYSAWNSLIETGLRGAGEWCHTVCIAWVPLWLQIIAGCIRSLTVTSPFPLLLPLMSLDIIS